jgi:alpha-ketoglutarate-dependent taurine dioxygenase
MYAVKAGRGATLLVDAAAAYASLSTMLASICDDSIARLDTGVERAVVQVHPDNGKPCLQVNTSQSVLLTHGQERSDSARTLSSLSRHLDTQAMRFEHSDGDLLVFDNARVLHKATEPGRQERLIWRVTTRFDESQLLALKAPSV